MSRPRDLVKGTLGLLILRTLELEPRHGVAIADRIAQITRGTFQSEGRIAVSGAASPRAGRRHRRRMVGLGRRPAHQGLPAHRRAGDGSSPRRSATGRGWSKRSAGARNGVAVAAAAPRLRGDVAHPRERPPARRASSTTSYPPMSSSSSNAAIAAGAAPDEARRAVLVAIGGVESVKEQVREVRMGRLVDETLRDVVYAWRGLRKAPGFTAAALAHAGARRGRQHRYLQRRQCAAGAAPAVPRPRRGWSSSGPTRPPKAILARRSRDPS